MGLFTAETLWQEATVEWFGLNFNILHNTDDNNHLNTIHICKILIINSIALHMMMFDISLAFSETLPFIFKWLWYQL